MQGIGLGFRGLCCGAKAYGILRCHLGAWIIANTFFLGGGGVGVLILLIV